MELEFFNHPALPKIEGQAEIHENLTKRKRRFRFLNHEKVRSSQKKESTELFAFTIGKQVNLKIL